MRKPLALVLSLTLSLSIGGLAAAQLLTPALAQTEEKKGAENRNIGREAGTPGRSDSSDRPLGSDTGGIKRKGDKMEKDDKKVKDEKKDHKTGREYDKKRGNWDDMGGPAGTPGLTK